MKQLECGDTAETEEKMPLSELDYKRIIIALETQERVSSPIMRSEWRVVLKNFLAEVQPFVSTSCQCEDRPCCSCDGDVYQPADYTDPGDLADRQRERMLAEDDEFCRICGEGFDDAANEDDVVQGFHADCAEAGND